MNKTVSPLYGALGGDMIGSVYERHNIKTKSFPLFSKWSKFTDDSVMTIAAADALLHKKGFAAAYQEWGRRYPYAGYGGSFRNWLAAENPQPYNSWGNGSAMRVSAAGFWAQSMEEALQSAQASAEVTHNHPEGIKGAQAAASAIFLARSGHSKAQIKAEMEQRFRYDLSSETLDEIRPGYSFDVSCQGTLPVALLAFLESKSYEDAIRNAVSVGGDSDTIGAITGGIALAFYREMPESIITGIEALLKPDMREICEQFAAAVQKRSIRQ